MQRGLSSGFTLVEILVVVGTGVAGITAAVAFPSFQERAARSGVGELVDAAARCKAVVAQFYTTNGRFPESAKEGGCPENVTANENPLAVYNGEVLVQAVGGLAAQLGPKNMIAFRAQCAGGVCDGAPIHAWSCASTASSTTVLPRYLPSSCR